MSRMRRCTHERWERIAASDGGENGDCPICISNEIDALRAENEQLRKVTHVAHVVVAIALGTGKVRGDDTSIAALFDALKAVEEKGNVPPQT